MSSSRLIAYLPTGERSKLEALLRGADPRGSEEACGLLVGTLSPDAWKIERVVMATNLAARPDRFEVDPGNIVATEDAARAEGLELLGDWHTHPGGPAIPSALDRSTAQESWLHLIAGEEGVRAWYMQDGYAHEVGLQG